ncbi:hypothetical protein O6X68_21385, partial [Salmonella enterica subsp. enterica]
MKPSPPILCSRRWVEECIFRQMPATQRVLFLWRNADTVVIGRAQNP